MASNQYDMQNPVTQYPKANFTNQPQMGPGLTSEMAQRPDHGEDTYTGHGRLKGRKALITGADSGIGRATAIAFAREGADIVLNYLPHEEADAQEVVDVVRETGVKVVTIPGDLTDEDFCKELVERSVQELGGLDILANIAGKQVFVENIADVTTEQFDRTFRTNVYAMFWLCKYSLEYLPAGATIINTASVQSYQPSAGLLDYASTKAAIVTFTKALAKQVASKGVRVNAIAPGPVWTPLQPSQGQPQTAIPDFGNQTPLGRPGQPAEVAPLYVFLASQESSYITAEIFGVTGGEHLP